MRSNNGYNRMDIQLLFFQDGRLCCTFDVRCPAAGQSPSGFVPSTESQSSQTLLHTTVTVDSDNVTVAGVSVSDAYPSDTTLG